MWKYLKWLILLIIVILVGVIVINREWAYDWWRGISYQPSSEMTHILDSLKLTGKGNFIFKAAQPVLNEREEFNTKCRAGRNDETAVLGCYTEGGIHVYNIESEELSGIRELTTAHELLHAVWARMNSSERHALSNDLKKVYDDNKEQLSKEIDSYNTNEQQEELYVRAGTEIKDLPNNLENHYAEIFQNQDLIASYYASYITVFLSIESEMNQLKAEMQSIQQEIDNTTQDYEQRVKQLNAEAAAFNTCAETADCFENEFVFESKRASLIEEQTALEEIYNQINQLVDEYNARVEQYNADVTHTDKLNQTINSTKKTQGL